MRAGESVERELLDEEHFDRWYETLLKEMAGKTDGQKIRSKSIAFKADHSICGIIGTAKRASGCPLWWQGSDGTGRGQPMYRIFAEKVKGPQGIIWRTR